MHQALNVANASTEEPKQTITETASINIGGQKMYYDPIKSPSFHKMMGSVNFNINTIKEKYSKEYGLVSQSLYPLEEGYNVKLSDGDKATIIEIIN